MACCLHDAGLEHLANAVLHIHGRKTLGVLADETAGRVGSRRGVIKGCTWGDAAGD